MGFFSVFDINISPHFHFGNKKLKEEEMKQKLNSIFAYVVLHLINGSSINEEIPKNIVKFIKSDIEKDLSSLTQQKQMQIAKAKRENDFQSKNFIQSNINNFNSARSVVETYKQHDDEFYFQRQQIEQNFIVEQQKILNEIISQYHNGTRLNDMDFNKLRSYFKDNKHIEECYNKILISK